MSTSMFYVTFALHFVHNVFSSSSTSFNGSELFPDGHACASCCFKEYTQLMKNDTMNSCDILSSSEGTTFLLLNTNGTLTIHRNYRSIWSSCDEYPKDECHEILSDSNLTIKENGILTLYNDAQSKILWEKGYSEGYMLTIRDDGHLYLYSSESSILWTSDTNFDLHSSSGNWQLILSHNCSNSDYFTQETARQIGTISDLLYSELTSLSEIKYQYDDYYLFKMVWPQSIEILDLVWKQSTNPSADLIVDGFDSLMDPFQKITWTGLHLSSETYSHKSLINGDSSSGWSFPVAVYENINTNNNTKECLPGPDILDNKFKYVEMVELWVKEYPVNDNNPNELNGEVSNNNENKKGELMIVGYPDEPVIESNNSLNWPVIAIRRILGKYGEIEAFCETSDGTAIKNQDYMYTRKELKWFDQEMITKTIKIPIIDDDIFELSEYFIVHCESLSSDVPINMNDIEIVIQGPNDVRKGQVIVLLNSTTIYINESIGNLTLNIQPTMHENDLVVDYTTQTINATCGEIDEYEFDEDDEDIEDIDIDYLNATGTLIWNGNDTSIKTVSITIIEDSLWEDNECFNFILYDKDIIHDNVTICIISNDKPANCSNDTWSEWSDCNVAYGLGEKLRSRNIGIKDFFGTIHCETVIQTEICNGNLSTQHKPEIMLSTNLVNISEDGILHNLPAMSSVIISVTSLPISNVNHSNDVKFIEIDSLIEITVEANAQIADFLDFQPANIIFNEKDWSVAKNITFAAVDDDSFISEKVIIQIDFKVISVDQRYHNFSIKSLFIHVWDDDYLINDIKQPKQNTFFDTDIRILTAIFCLILSIIALCLSFLRAKYRRYKEWKSHHDLHFDQLTEEEDDDYSDFSDLNLDEPEFNY